VEIKAIKELSVKELQTEVTESKAELLQMNLRKGQLEKPHLFNVSRKKIARLKTILKQKLSIEEGTKS